MKKSMIDPYKDWILKNYKNYYSYIDLVVAIEKEFGIRLNEYTLRDWLRKQLGTTNVFGIRGVWSAYDISFLKANYTKYGAYFVAQMLKRSESAVTDMAFRMGITTEGSKHRKEVPIGTIHWWSDNRGGTVPWIKYAPGNSKSGWKPLSHYIWEQENGPIPNGYQIIYLNGNSNDCYIENIEIVSQNIFLAVTKNKHYKSNNPDITKCLIRYYQLREALGITCADIKNYERKFKQKYKMEVE